MAALAGKPGETLGGPRVLFFQPLADGGIAHYTHNLMGALARQGARIGLITTVDYEFRGEHESYEVFPVLFRVAGSLLRLIPWLNGEYPLPSLLRKTMKAIEYPISAIRALVIVLRERPAAVHVQTVNLSELVMVGLLKAAKTPVVFTIHNVIPLHRKLRGHQRVLLRLLYRMCDRIIIHTESGKREAVALFGIAPDKVHVLRHGDYKFFLSGAEQAPAEAKDALGIAPERLTLLFFGAIRPNKGLDTLLRALPPVTRAVPSALLIIAGEPCEDYTRYRALISEGDLQGHVLERLGYIPNAEVGRYFSAADIVVLPYHEITQSGVLQIAYAFGKPIVASALAGFSEAVEEGRNGCLFPPGDAAACSRLLTSLLQDPARCTAMGRRSRQLSDQEYSWDAIARQTLPLYGR